MTNANRRRFVSELAAGSAVLPFLSPLASAGIGEQSSAAPKRFIVMFSPNGTLPDEFWPDRYGDEPLQLKSMLEPLSKFHAQILMLNGVNNAIGGDGDNHMRGMSCLLTAARLNKGNIQGGGHTPAGWASGISIDQEMANFFHAQPGTRTRFKSLEFGVAVPNRADPWTRMCYAGNDRPVAPIDDPKVMFKKLYGGAQQRKIVSSVLDGLKDELAAAAGQLSKLDRALLDEHMDSVRQLEKDLEAAESQRAPLHPEPDIDPNIELVNDNTPLISRLQIDLMVNALANDMTRVASLQFMRSVGQARMRWLDIEDGHHSLSHQPDNDQAAHQKLHRINNWFAGELAYLAERLSSIPEPGRSGETLLDNTQIVWLNELGKGNSHTLDNIPFLLLGGGANFKTGRGLQMGGVPHNRLWLAIANGLGHHGLENFGSAEHCQDGPLELTT